MRDYIDSFEIDEDSQSVETRSADIGDAAYSILQDMLAYIKKHGQEALADLSLSQEEQLFSDLFYAYFNTPNFDENKDVIDEILTTTHSLCTLVRLDRVLKIEYPGYEPAEELEEEFLRFANVVSNNCADMQKAYRREEFKPFTKFRMSHSFTIEPISRDI